MMVAFGDTAHWLFSLVILCFSMCGSVDFLWSVVAGVLEELTSPRRRNDHLYELGYLSYV